jgi:uncharacterized membrane protein YcfT
VNERLVHLDDSRPYFRAFAAIFYILGKAIAFWVVCSMLRSTLWGVAAGLLWLARGRDPLLYVFAAVALGFTITVKIHAVALVVPLAIAIAFRPPARPSGSRSVAARATS